VPPRAFLLKAFKGLLAAEFCRSGERRSWPNVAGQIVGAKGPSCRVGKDPEAAVQTQDSLSSLRQGSPMPRTIRLLVEAISDLRPPMRRGVSQLCEWAFKARCDRS